MADIQQLGFSARDLITQLVREDGSIQGNLSRLEDPVWLHRAGYPNKPVQHSEVRELLLYGLIEYWKAGPVIGHDLYRPSTAGQKAAGTRAAADAERSARRF